MISIDTIFVLHYYFVMKNVAITVDEEVARWARVRAAEKDTSLSRLVGDLLRERMIDESNDDLSMQNYLAHPASAEEKRSHLPRP